MKKHQALQAELAGHEPRINNVSQQGAEMIKDGHFAADEIQDKISELEDRWQTLKVRVSTTWTGYLHIKMTEVSMWVGPHATQSVKMDLKYVGT